MKQRDNVKLRPKSLIKGKEGPKSPMKLVCSREDLEMVAENRRLSETEAEIAD